MLADLADRAVAAHPRDRLAVSVDRVGDARKSPSRTLRKSSPPIVPRREEAPTTATLARREERPQRGSTADVIALLDAVLVPLGRRELELPPRRRRSHALASARSRRARRASSMPRLSGRTSATNRSIADGRGSAGELLEQPCSDSTPLIARPRPRTPPPPLSGRGGARSSRRRRRAPRRSSGERAEQRTPLDPVRLEQRLDQLHGAGSASRGSGGAGSARRACGRSRGAAPRLRPSATAGARCRRRGG